MQQEGRKMPQMENRVQQGVATPPEYKPVDLSKLRLSSYNNYNYLIYGKAGVGKTTLVSEIPNSFIVMADGNLPNYLDELNGINLFDMPKEALSPEEIQARALSKFTNFLKCINHPQQSFDFDFLVIDNLTSLVSLYTNYCLNVEGVTSLQEGYGKGSRRLFQEISRLFTMLVDLAKKKNFNLVFVAHEVLKDNYHPDGAVYKRSEVDLPRQIADLFLRGLDIVANVFTDVSVTRHDMGFNKSFNTAESHEIKIGIASSPWRETKNRVGVGLDGHKNDIVYRYGQGWKDLQNLIKEQLGKK